MQMWFASCGSATWIALAGVCFLSGCGGTANANPSGGGGQQTAQTFYVSASGSDSNDGLSATTAWKTISKVNAASYISGDQILFHGGDTFSGSIALTAPNASDHLTINTYGSGTASVSSGQLPCVSLTNLAAATIGNLQCTGSGVSSNSAFGIVVANTLPGNTRLSGPTITNNIVSGYGDNGIEIAGTSGTSGFDGVTITSNVVHDVTGNEANVSDDSACIRVISNPSYPNPVAHTNVNITNNVVYNCPGQQKASNNTGSGILLSTVNGASIANNVVYHTGTLNATCGGPNGIWVYSSANAVIEFNETYDNETDLGAGGCDGNGFDLDGGVTNSVVEYNYSHDNFGADFLVYAYHDSTQPQWSGNIFRYNIGQNSARAFLIANDDSLSMTSCYIYNNTLYDPVAIVGVNARAAINCIFANNIFFTEGSSPGNAINVPNPSSILMVGNDYVNTGTFQWGGVGYSSFAAWQTAAGQESLSGSPTGTTANPELVNPSGGPTTNGYKPALLSAYQLQPGSPMIGAGLDLHALYGISVGTQDFFGVSIPNASEKYNIGAGGQE